MQGVSHFLIGAAPPRRLVGIAELEPTKDVLLNKFLMLPNDCKALMSAQFAFGSSMAG